MGGWVKRWKILEQIQLNRLQMVQFECPKYRYPCVLFTFHIFSPCYLFPSDQPKGFRPKPKGAL